MLILMPYIYIININQIIIDKINKKLPIFTTNLFPIEKLYQR